jgi:hypothetical protein
MTLKDFFTKADAAAHTFVKYAATALSAFLKYEPTIAHLAQTLFNYILPLLQEILTVEFGAGVASEAIAAAQLVISKLVAVQSLIHDYGVTGSVLDKLTEIAGDFDNLMAAGFIKSTASQSYAKRIIVEILAFVSAGKAHLPAPTPTPAV